MKSIRKLFAKARKLLCLVVAWDKNYLLALWNGTAAAVEHDVVLRNIGQCATVVDIGANKGQFALCARHWLPRATIYCYEPLEGPSALCSLNFRGDTNVVVVRRAIGPDQGSALIHVSKRDDSSSLLAISERQVLLHPGTDELETATIEIARLDKEEVLENIPTPAFLKIDVQGYELSTLKGCEEILGRFSFVYVECSFVELYVGQSLAHEVISWLAKRDFELQGIYNLTNDELGRAVQGDFLFCRNN